MTEAVLQKHRTYLHPLGACVGFADLTPWRPIGARGSCSCSHGLCGWSHKGCACLAWPADHG